MNGLQYNNPGIVALSMLFVLRYSGPLPIGKLMLIAPIVASPKMISYLSRKSTRILSVEKFVAEKMEFVANFEGRYYDGLIVSMNSVQLLLDLRLVKFESALIIPLLCVDYDNRMGKRAKSIFGAAANIASLINVEASVLYSILRVKI